MKLRPVISDTALTTASMSALTKLSVTVSSAGCAPAAGAVAAGLPCAEAGPAGAARQAASAREDGEPANREQASVARARMDAALGDHRSGGEVARDLPRGIVGRIERANDDSTRDPPETGHRPRRGGPERTIWRQRGLCGESGRDRRRIQWPTTAHVGELHEPPTCCTARRGAVPSSAAPCWSRDRSPPCWRRAPPRTGPPRTSRRPSSRRRRPRPGDGRTARRRRRAPRRRLFPAPPGTSAAAGDPGRQRRTGRGRSTPRSPSTAAA